MCSFPSFLLAQFDELADQVFAKSAAPFASGDSYVTSSKRKLPDVRTVKLLDLAHQFLAFR